MRQSQGPETDRDRQAETDIQRDRGSERQRDGGSREETAMETKVCDGTEQK